MFVKECERFLWNTNIKKTWKLKRYTNTSNLKIEGFTDFHNPI
jgi:hypothetical protein